MCTFCSKILEFWAQNSRLKLMCPASPTLQKHKSYQVLHSISAYINGDVMFIYNFYLSRLLFNHSGYAKRVVSRFSHTVGVINKLLIHDKDNNHKSI